MFCLVFFVDRFKQGSYCGVGIIQCEELYKYLDNDVLICAPSAYNEVKSVLESVGYKRAFHVLGILKYAKNRTFVNLHDRLPAEKLVEMYSYYMDRSSY